MVCTFCRKFQSKPSKNLAIQHDTHAGQAGHVQVVRQLYGRLHLHVGLEDAAAERCLTVGLLASVLTAVFIRLTFVTFVEMVRGWLMV
jgi:hypothetical protein